MVIRPPMLPEDFRFTNLGPNELPTEALEWLRIVFRTWGAFVLGFGVLLMAIAGFVLKSQPAFLRWGVPTALVVSFGRFLASNLMLRSDFLWFIAGLFVLSALTAVGFALPASRMRKSNDDVPRTASGST